MGFTYSYNFCTSSHRTTLHTKRLCKIVLGFLVGTELNFNKTTFVLYRLDACLWCRAFLLPQSASLFQSFISSDKCSFTCSSLSGIDLWVAIRM